MQVYEVSALLEYYHKELEGIRSGKSLSWIAPELDGFTIIDSSSFPGKPEEKYIKAITVKDFQGNVYVHFYGTGDGNWGYNAAAYGAEPQPSEMQTWALSYFDGIVKKYYEGQSPGNLYVSGHSQGGNNAQFVTIRSEYADYISQCISLDGPGFSHQFVEESKALYGEAFYERQREKIYGYYGENDYVSLLGQETIVKDDHIKYVRYTGEGFDVSMFHMIDGMLGYRVNKDGNKVPTGFTFVTDDTRFRKYLAEALEKVKELPPEKQARAAELVMMVCEDIIGADEPLKSNMTSEEFNELKEILVPFIVDVLADNPENIAGVLEELGLNPAAAESVVDLIEHINTYSSSEREILIASLLSLIDYEDGGIKLNTSAIPATILAAWPVILETALTHPDDIMTVIHELGVDKAVINWIEEHPIKFTGVCIGLAILAPVWMPIAEAFIIAGALVDVGIRIVQAAEWIGGKIKDAVLKTFNALKNAISAIRQWYRSTFNAGVKYVANNPYFKADTAKLRNYASRIDRVNSRLRSLDSGLRSLYWQVGLLDLWDILCANLLTGGSPTLNQVKAYLNNTANRLENAENKARGYVGG